MYYASSVGILYLALTLALALALTLTLALAWTGRGENGEAGEKVEVESWGVD
jgi:hypothetical protein